MTTTPPDAPSGADAPHQHEHPHEGPRVTRDEVRDLGRLRRSVTDRKLAGVAGGLARHLDIDPVILRVAFVVLSFFGGAGLILYGACWLLLPEEGSDSAPLHLDDRTRGIALIIVGILAAAALVGDTWGGFGFPWPLAIVALVVLLVLNRRDAHRAHHPAQQPGQQHAPSAPAYGHPAYPPTGWTAPPPSRPRSPRKRGPVLFWFTLALVVLAEGVLGIVDLAGVSVAAPAYPALALGICGLVLLVGAFWGRAGGVVLLGLLSMVALTGATAADHWDGQTVNARPRNAADVHSSYHVTNGELVVDLSNVRDTDQLDGRTLRVSGDVGRIEVVLPDDLDADVRADIHGPGAIGLFGQEKGGIDISDSSTLDVRGSAGEIRVDAQLSVGRIEVHQR